MSQTVTWVQHRCVGCGFELSAVKGAYGCPKCNARMEPIQTSREPPPPPSKLIGEDPISQTPIMVRYNCPHCGKPLRGPKGKGFICPKCGTMMRHPPEPAVDAEPQSVRDPDPQNPGPESLPLYPVIRIGVFLIVGVSIILIVAGVAAMLDSGSRLIGLALLAIGICGLPSAELLQLAVNVADDIRKTRRAIERNEDRHPGP